MNMKGSGYIKRTETDEQGESLSAFIYEASTTDREQGDLTYSQGRY